MRARASNAAVPAALAAACAVLAGATTQYGDYPFELAPAVHALLGGHLREALASAPVYGGSLLPRVPFVLAAHALGGGALAVYRAGAFACLLAVAALLTALDRRLAAAGRSGAERLALVATCLLSVALLRCLSLGHPEEALGGALCAGAVLLALGDRPVLAGLALGFAGAVKPWAVLAVAPVLFALPAWRSRAQAVAFAALAAGAALAPFALADLTHFTATQRGAASAAVSFEPQQLFWPLHVAHTHVAGGVVYHGAGGPAWVQRLSHPLIVAFALPLSALFALGRRRAGAARTDALALLALLLVLRCALDPWNQPYYAIPAILALASWEVTALRRAPLWAPAAAALTWLAFHGPRMEHTELRYAAIVLWTATLAAVLGARMWPRPRRARGAAAQATSSATAARSAA